MALYDSWKALVYGRPVKRRKIAAEAPPMLLLPVEWDNIPIQRRVRGGFHTKAQMRRVARRANVRLWDEAFRDREQTSSKRYGEQPTDRRDRRGDTHLFARK